MNWKWRQRTTGVHMNPAVAVGLNPPRSDLTIRVNLDLFVSEAMAEQIFDLVMSDDTLKANGH